MTLGASFLQSKVGRRVLALFILSALIPLAFFSVFAYRQVTHLLTDQAQRELTMFSASYGGVAYERLLLAQRTLDSVVAELTRDAESRRLLHLAVIAGCEDKHSHGVEVFSTPLTPAPNGRRARKKRALIARIERLS